MTAHEEVRKQSMKATESEKMKTAFLNSICHEIRTPLNSIAGFSELIFDESFRHGHQTRIPAVDTKQFYRVSFFDGQYAEPVSNCQLRTASSCGVYRRIRTMC